MNTTTTVQQQQQPSFEDEVSFLEGVMGGCISSSSHDNNNTSGNSSSSSGGKELSLTEELYCPRVFDGWSCWNATLAGQRAHAPCPWFIAGFDPTRHAHKDCLVGGEWYRHPVSNLVWSNYTNCVDINALHTYQNVTLVYEVGYLVSLAALTTSLAIFCAFTSLSCARVSIHKHLFTSFILNNSLWLAWYELVVNNVNTPVNTLNQPLCIGLHVCVQYFLVANYFWMFCEGLYLHTLLVYAFVQAEETLLNIFVAFAWAGPAVPVALYALFRATDPHLSQHHDCWIDESPGWGLFLSVPVCVCLVLSLIFLLNILRVLILKLNTSSRVLHHHHAGAPTSSSRRESNKSTTAAAAKENIASLRKAARATLILVPLLGVHYLILPFRPSSDSPYFLVYQYLAAVASSLQGLAVSTLFCFCNNDVANAISRKRRQLQQNYYSSSGRSRRRNNGNVNGRMTTLDNTLLTTTTCIVSLNHDNNDYSVRTTTGREDDDDVVAV